MKRHFIKKRPRTPLGGTETVLKRLYKRFLALQSEIVDGRTRHNERPKFSDSIEALIEHMKSERGLSLNYQVSTLRSLKKFSDWISDAYPAKDPKTTLTCDLAKYLATEQARGLAPASMKSIVFALKFLFSFLKSRGRIEEDPAKPLRPPKLPKHLPDVLNAVEIGQLLSANLAGMPFPFRTQAILELFCASGLRVDELRHARLENLDLENRTLRVMGKGSKWRIVPFSPRCREALIAYMQNERSRLVKTNSSAGIIFLSRHHKTLTSQRLWQIVREAGNLAGLKTQVHPHLLRHSLATGLLKNGADLRVIQEVLGHADISTTQIYTHIDQAGLKSTHRQFHPRG